MFLLIFLSPLLGILAEILYLKNTRTPYQHAMLGYSALDFIIPAALGYIWVVYRTFWFQYISAIKVL